MKKSLYYFILVVFVAVAMVTTAAIFGSLNGFDSVGIKGMTAGAGLLVIYNKKRIFELLDKLMFKK